MLGDSPSFPSLELLSAPYNSSETQPLAGLINYIPSSSNLLQGLFDMVTPADLTNISPSPATPEQPPFPYVDGDETRGTPSTILPEHEEDDLNIEDEHSAALSENGTSNSDDDNNKMEGVHSTSLADKDKNSNE